MQQNNAQFPPGTIPQRFCNVLPQLEINVCLVYSRKQNGVFTLSEHWQLKPAIARFSLSSILSHRRTSLIVYSAHPGEK